MKKYIGYIIIFLFTFLFFSVDKAEAMITILIDENGNIVHDRDYKPSDDETFSYSNGVLELYNTSDTFYPNDNVYAIYSMVGLQVKVNKDVYISALYVNGNLEIETSTPDDFTYINKIEGGLNSEKIELKNIKLDNVLDLLAFNDTIIENAVINTPESEAYVDLADVWSYGVIYQSWDTDYSIQIHFYNEDGSDAFVWDNLFEETNLELKKESSYHFKDSTIRSLGFYGKYGDTVFENTDIILKLTAHLFKSSFTAINSNIHTTDKNDRRYGIFINNYATDMYFENTNVELDTLSFSVYNQYSREEVFNNCTIDVYTSNNANMKLNDSTFTVKDFMGSIEAHNSEINFAQYISNMDHLYLYDSKLQSVKGITVYDQSENISEYSFKIINSEVDINASYDTDSVSSNGIYIEKSKVNFTPKNWYSNKKDGYDNTGKITIIDSDVTANYTTSYNEFRMENSKLTSNRLDVDEGNSTLYMNKSEILVNSDYEYGIRAHDLDFTGSHLISRATKKAWISDIDITTHNLVGINEAKDIMSMNSFLQSNNTKYSFYDNEEISKYVEIKTPLKVTFKIVNGTWNDGTTEDKYVESYFFGSINEVDVPKDMVPSDGYENGSWDKEIVYDELKDEYIYTYEFKPKGTTPEKKSSSKKENKKEEKEKLKNPDTGAFLSITAIGILAVICIKVLKYTKKKNLFNKL